LEHSIQTLDPVLRPWRTAAVVAAGIAAVELVVLIAVGVALLGRPIARHMRNAALDHALAPLQPGPPAGSLEAGAAKLPRNATEVLVLNGNGRAGAAAGAAAEVRRLGYGVGAVGNATRSDYTTSVVMYRPRYRGEAVRLARDLHLRTVGPLDGIGERGLMGAHLALVIGN
jgi:LytR cell envelope-related transcriptional attenuator